MNYTQLYKTHFADIYRYVFFHTGQNTPCAEDLTSEIFLKAYKSWLRDKKPLSKTWIYQIAKNHIIDFYRTTKQTIDIDSVEIADTKTPFDHLEKKDKKTRLKKILSLLTESKRDLIILRYINGYSTKELAEIHQTSQGAIRVRLHEAMKTLKSLIKKHSIESPL